MTRISKDKQYRVTLKAGEWIKVGSLTLRADKPHIVSGGLLAANKEKVAEYVEV